MMRPLPSVVCLISLAASVSGIQSAPVILDRIAAVVGNHAIKTSDIDRELRMTEFLNRDRLDLGTPRKREALQRLIDQQLIRAELEQTGNTARMEEGARKLLAQIREERFTGSKTAMENALKNYGLREDQLVEHLEWQLAVLRFIDDRFRLGVVVSDEDVRDYYQQHKAELSRKDPNNQSLEAAEPAVRDLLTSQRIDRNFDEWLHQVRMTAHIEYKLDELRT